MTDPANSNVKGEVQYMMDRLDGFARNLGLTRTATRQIVEKVLADMPTRTTQERLTEARARMVGASA
ncbi:hypothetical protein [Methylobacterium sp. CM6257]